jgi:formylglycine-generating enzyme required for sulfatase activity
MGEFDQDQSEGARAPAQLAHKASNPAIVAARILGALGLVWLAAFAIIVVNVGWIFLQWPLPLALWLTAGCPISLAAGLLMLWSSFHPNRGRSANRLERAAALAALLPANPAAVALLPVTSGIASTLRRGEGRRLGRIRLAAAALASAAIVAGIVYIETDRGEIIVDAPDASVDVRMTQNGREIRVLEAGKSRIVVLPGGEYELRAGGPEDSYVVTPGKITLSRNDRQLVTVRTIPKHQRPEEHPAYDEAVKVSDLWVRLIHSGKYAEAHQALASSQFRGQTSEQEFVSATKALSERLGPMGLPSRPIIEFKTSLEHLGPGEYMVFEWKVPFMNAGQMVQHVERLALIVEDGKWKVIEYELQDRPQPVAVAGVESPDAKAITNSIGMQLTLIPSGEFLMGSPETESGRKASWEHQHRVKLTKPFYMGVYEVTQREYQTVTSRDPFEYSPRGNGKAHVEGMDTSRFPAETISWGEAAEFCRRLTELPEERRAGRRYRLPTEAEWEYACRAGTTTQNHFGQELTLELANVLIGESGAANPSLMRPTTVGAYPPNAFGLYDMHGNVSEWVADWFEMGYFKESPLENPSGPASSTIMPGGGARTIKGGSCVDPMNRLRSAYRSYRPPDYRGADLGFRVVCEVK